MDQTSVAFAGAPGRLRLYELSPSFMSSALLPVFHKIRVPLFLVQLIYDIVSSASSVERCPEGQPPVHPSFLSFTTIPKDLAGQGRWGP